MPKHTHQSGRTARQQHAPTIRDCLERDAWGRYPEFAARQARIKGLVFSPGHGLRWHDRVLLILAIILLALVLLRSENANAGDAWGMEFIADSGEWSSLALETEVDVDVTGLVARAEVRQRFVNRENAWAEGVYRFPLPDGAAVDRLQIEVGSRMIVGEIQEREEARRIYQKARANGQVASLVEKQRPNQYESRLANIGPGESIRVTIGFQFNVDWRDGSFRLRLPMTFTPRWEAGDPASENPAAPSPAFTAADRGVHAPLELQVLLRSQLGYASIESRYHDVDIRPVPEGYRIDLLPGSALPDRDFELAWAPDLAAVPQAEILTWDGGEAVYAQLLVIPPLRNSLGPRSRELVFIIDTSGSMQGASLDQARAALLRGLDQLDPGDMFDLVQFNSETETLFETSVPATAARLETARRYLAGLRADGGTVMAPALQAALSLPRQPGLLRQVVFITDGSVGNERELLLQIADNLGDTRLFTVSIGSAPNSWFMRKAAEIGRGSHSHIGQLKEVEERMNALWSRIRYPAVSDICIDFGTDAEYYPEVIPDLYAGDPLWITARMPLQPGEIELCGAFDGQPWDYRTAPQVSPGAEALASVWATRKIEALEDSIIFGADPAEIRKAVTDLAMERGLLTRYTSLVAVDRTPARRPGEPLESASIPSLLPAGSTRGTAGFPPTGTGWVARALLSALTLLIATGLFLFCGARLPLAPSKTANASAAE